MENVNLKEFLAAWRIIRSKYAHKEDGSFGFTIEVWGIEVEVDKDGDQTDNPYSLKEDIEFNWKWAEELSNELPAECENLRVLHWEFSDGGLDGSLMIEIADLRKKGGI